MLQMGHRPMNGFPASLARSRSSGEAMAEAIITEDNKFDHIISIPLYRYNILVDYFAI